MNCSEARIQLSGYVDGELSASQGSRLDVHVSACAACQRELSAQSFVHTELRRELTRFEASAALHRRIRKALQAKSAESRMSWWRRLNWATLTPVAGMAFAVLVCANVVILALCAAAAGYFWYRVMRWSFQWMKLLPRDGADSGAGHSAP